jgi:hypothetical protein
MSDDLIKRKRTAQVILIVGTLFFALAIAPGIWVAMMSLMLFDSGKSTDLQYLYALYPCLM